MRRIVESEFIDDPRIDPRELDRAMEYLRRTNIRMGGVESLLGPLRRWSAGWPRNRTVTLLDLGTGSGDLPLAAREWARRGGFDLRITAIDASARTLEIARRQLAGTSGVTLRHLNAWQALDAFGPRSFDYVHCGLFLHHLPDVDVPRMLGVIDRIARVGLIAHDILRTNRGWLIWWLLTAAQPRISRHDARASYRSGFSGDEIRSHALAAGLSYCAYSENFMRQRWVLSGEREPSSAGRWNGAPEHPRT